MAYTDYTPQQASEIGEALYERDLRASLEPGNIGKYIVINIENGEYEVGDNDMEFSHNLHDRQPMAALYCIRIGYRSMSKIGFSWSALKRTVSQENHDAIAA